MSDVKDRATPEETLKTADYIPLPKDDESTYLVVPHRDENHQRKRKRNNGAHETSRRSSNRYAALTPTTDLPDEDHEDYLDHSSPPAKAKRLSHHEAINDAKEGGDDGNKPRLKYAGPHRVQAIVRLAALQQLVLYCIADDVGPNWIGVHKHNQVRKAVVLMIPGLEKDMFTGQLDLDRPAKRSDQGVLVEPDATDASLPVQNSPTKILGKNPDDFLPVELQDRSLHSTLEPLASMFERVWPVKAPGDERYNRLYSPVQAILSSPLPKSEVEKRQKRNSLSTTAKRDKTQKQSPAKDQSNAHDQKTPITYYLVTNEELHEHDYPIHPAIVSISDRVSLLERRTQNGRGPEDGWQDTRITEVAEANVSEGEIEQGSLTAGRIVYTIDCEMCMAGEGYVLTRVSMIDWDGKVVIDELVKPDKPITNYLTQFSGITEEMLVNVTTSLRDVQEKLLKLITPQTILAGHSIESDLRALKLTHPFLVDTALAYPHPSGPPLRSSLKFLSQKYLGRAIQQGHGNSGHDSVEDARATLALIKLKCEKGPSFGTSILQQESIMRRISRSRGRLEAGDEAGLARRSGAIVDVGTPERTFVGVSPYYIGADDDAGVVDGICRAVNGDSDGAYIPGGGVDFVWARFRGLEMARGWSSLGEKSGDGREEAFVKESSESAADESPTSLANSLATTVAHVQAIQKVLPPCTLFLIYSGTGNAQELFRLQALYKQFRNEYAVKKWDELSVKWTDVEEQAIKRACGVARNGIAMMTITQ